MRGAGHRVTLPRPAHPWQRLVCRPLGPVHRVRRHYGVVNADYKLIHFHEKDVDEWELYDRKKDPHELTSVHDDPAYAETRQALETELRRLQKYYRDTP